MINYTTTFDPATGKLLGVCRNDGAFVPAAADNGDWISFLKFNATAETPLSLTDRPAQVPPTPQEMLDKTRADALGSMNSRDDLTAFQVRLALSAVVFLVNNRLESLGQRRVTEDEIFDYIEKNPTSGDPQST